MLLQLKQFFSLAQNDRPNTPIVLSQYVFCLTGKKYLQEEHLDVPFTIESQEEHS
jgi:hypothetical protein